MSSEEQRRNREQSTIAWLIDEHSMAIAIAIYGVVVAPFWWWLVGHIGVSGVVSGEMAGISLIAGGLMFVPGIMSWLRKKKFELGYAESQQAKDRMVVDTTEQTGQAADRFRTGAGGADD